MSIDHDSPPQQPAARKFEALARRSLTYDTDIIPNDHPHFLELRARITQDYLKDGTVLPSQLENGLIPDHFKDNSVIFDVHDKTADDDRFRTGARLLLPTPEKGLEALQIRLEELDEEPKRMIMEQYERDPGSIAEFATHLMAPDTSPFALVALYRGMASYSNEHGIKTWIGGLRPTIVDSYEQSLPGVLHRLGDEVHLGDLKNTFVPFAIDVEKLGKVLFAPKTIGGKAITSTFTPVA